MKTAENIILEKNREIISVSTDTKLIDALQKMIQHRVGAILVTSQGAIVGIWTERDLMYNTVQPQFDPHVAVIKDYMISNLISAPHTDSVYHLMDKFLGLRISHLLIEKEGKTIGLLSVGDVMKACLHEKTSELTQLNTVCSWNYYEEWKWKKQ